MVYDYDCGGEGDGLQTSVYGLQKNGPHYPWRVSSTCGPFEPWIRVAGAVFSIPEFADELFPIHLVRNAG